MLRVALNNYERRFTSSQNTQAEAQYRRTHIDKHAIVCIVRKRTYNCVYSRLVHRDMVGRWSVAEGETPPDIITSRLGDPATENPTISTCCHQVSEIIVKDSLAM